jgi:hypothetical protein
MKRIRNPHAVRFVAAHVARLWSRRISAKKRIGSNAAQALSGAPPISIASVERTQSVRTKPRNRRMNMKTFVALSAVVAGPAFAQAPTRNHAFHQQSSSMVHPYAAHGYGYNNNDNRDFQLGGGER